MLDGAFDAVKYVPDKDSCEEAVLMHEGSAVMSEVVVEDLADG